MHLNILYRILFFGRFLKPGRLCLICSLLLLKPPREMGLEGVAGAHRCYPIRSRRGSRATSTVLPSLCTCRYHLRIGSSFWSALTGSWFFGSSRSSEIPQLWRSCYKIFKVGEAEGQTSIVYPPALPPAYPARSFFWGGGSWRRRTDRFPRTQITTGSSGIQPHRLKAWHGMTVPRMRVSALVRGRQSPPPAQSPPWSFEGSRSHLPRCTCPGVDPRFTGGRLLRAPNLSTSKLLEVGSRDFIIPESGSFEPLCLVERQANAEPGAVCGPRARVRGGEDPGQPIEVGPAAALRQFGLLSLPTDP